MIEAFLFGLVTGLGLIVAIGAQNAFVIRQGILRRRVFAVCLTCAVIDAALIIAGVAGLGTLIAESVWLTRIAAWGGAAFLIFYGAKSAWNAVRRDHKGLHTALRQATGAAATVRAAVLTAAAFSLLNPHVYLDTVVMLGGLGAQLEIDARAWFAAGASTASVLWFFGIGYGARAASPLFERPAATRALDLFVAAVMALVATYLIWGQIVPD